MALVAFVVVVMFLRRPDQFLHPYVWVEDGAINLPDFAAHGWSSVLHPLVGYIILPVKLIHAVAMSLSFRWYPEISTALTLAFTSAVLLAVAIAPTRLRYPFACAAAVVLVPTDAEVFGVSLYAGWWGSLLVIPPLLWREGARAQVWRAILLVMGALSSPLIIALLPLYALRAWRTRARADFVMLALATSLGGLQAFFLLHLGALPQAGSYSMHPGLFIAKFFGYFLFWSPTYPSPYLYFALGTLLLAFVAFAGWRFRHLVPAAAWWLLACLICAAVLSALRASLPAIHPIVAGPRYFFLPDALLCWTLLQLFAVPARWTRLALFAIALLAGRNLLLYGTRHHDAVDWRAEVDACSKVEHQRFPVHYAGDRRLMWYADLAGSDCRRLITNSLFDRRMAP